MTGHERRRTMTQRRLWAVLAGLGLALGLWARAEAADPAVMEAAKKEGKVVWYSSLGLSVAQKVCDAFNKKALGITCELARDGVPAHLPEGHAGGLGRARDRRRRAHLGHLALPRLPAEGHADALPARGGRQVPVGLPGPGRPLHRPPRHALRDRLQHAEGRPGRCPQALARSRRPPLEGQARPRPPRLQRGGDDRDPRAAPGRRRVGLLRGAGEERSPGRAVRRGPADEAVRRRGLGRRDR